MEVLISKEKHQEAVSVIQQVNQKTKHTWLFTKFGNTLLFLAEWLCYLLLIGLIAFAIYLPSGELNETQQLADNVTVSTTVQVKEIMQFFVILKGLVVFLGLLMVMPALLFRNIRKKNNLLEELNDVTGQFLKSNQTNKL